MARRPPTMSAMETTAPRIKFCGITNSADADAAVEASAWALGMILWRGSPRRCRIQDAAEIAAVHRRRVELVGVFVNPGLDQVVDAADQIGLTILQFHGDEGPSFCAEAARRTGCRVIKAARVRSGAEIQALAAFHTDFHLLDTYVDGVPGGTGATFAWELAAGHRGKVPLILLGRARRRQRRRRDRRGAPVRGRRRVRNRVGSRSQGSRGAAGIRGGRRGDCAETGTGTGTATGTRA